MYFPYLRGRQYEMLALRELSQGNLLGSRVIPVVEPIKLTSTFNGVIKLFTEKNLPLALIMNPAVGELSDGSAIGEISPFITGPIIPSMIMDRDTVRAMSALSANGMRAGTMLAIITNPDCLGAYRETFGDLPPRFTLFPDERQIRRTIIENKVLFEDKFKKQERNADYLKYEDEFYSDDHLFFSEEGYVGFGDYSIVGDEYNEGGFAPYAVAIHIVYFADDNTLRVRHFVSSSNDDISDVAGKYHEAIIRLRQWYGDGQSRQLTAALSTLLSHAESGYYPGLPTIKKLSIMHHLELIGKYLDGGMRE